MTFMPNSMQLLGIRGGWNGGFHSLIEQQYMDSIPAAELLQAQADLWNHIFQHIGSKSLKSAVDLGIPDAIHRHGGPISLSDLASALAIPPAKTPQFGRLMRVLTHTGIFSTQNKSNHGGIDDNEDGGGLYILTPVSRLLVKGAVGDLTPFLLTMLDHVFVAPLQFLTPWFGDGGSSTPFAAAHGCELWDFANRNPAFNETFNDAMASDSRFLSGILVTECADLFRGLTSLVDIGGGTGTIAKAIAEAFPHVKCSVLDLPHVVDTVTGKGAVEFVAGDMFHFVPPANAVLLKWILHDWDDDDCVKILRRCKEAIPSREEGGKIIIIDLVVGSNGHHKTRETQLYWDMTVLSLLGAIEREEKQWRKIFIKAGFDHYKITPALGLRSVIELYP